MNGIQIKNFPFLFIFFILFFILNHFLLNLIERVCESDACLADGLDGACPVGQVLNELSTKSLGHSQRKEEEKVWKEEKSKKIKN